MNSEEKKFVPEWWDLWGMILTGDKRLLVIVPAIVLFCVGAKDTDTINLNLPDMMNEVLVTLLALYRFVYTYVWPTMRSFVLAVSPIAIVAFIWRFPRAGARAKTADAEAQD